MRRRFPIRLWHRLFLAFAALVFAAIVGLTWLQQRHFETGLLDYVNRQQQDQIEAAAHRLARAYATNGSWEFLRRDRRLFRDLIVDDGRAPPDGPPSGAPNGPPGRPDGPPPRAGPAPAGGAPDGIMRRVALLDANRRHIVGNRALVDGLAADPLTGNLMTVAISRAGDGKDIVGYLIHQPLPRLNNDVDIAFARSQMRQALLAAAGLLLLAAVAAVVLSRWFLIPVRALSETARALAAGNYAARVAPPSATRNDEFGELAQDFNRAAGALQANQSARQRWTADIAHELRTPLTILQGDLQALQEGVRKPDPATLASLSEECVRLGRVVEDLYQLAMSDSGALAYRFAAVDLAATVGRVASAMRPAFTGAGLQLILRTPPAPAWVRADEQRLGQLVGNLLQNAMRYTDAPGRVEVSVQFAGQNVELRVDDSAPGVGDEHLPHIFERLYRVDDSRGRSGGQPVGAGLGLSICRSIADAHGGQLVARPSPLGGLQVVFSLPTGTSQ